jgi:hypothetical protein
MPILRQNIASAQESSASVSVPKPDSSQQAQSTAPPLDASSAADPGSPALSMPVLPSSAAKPASEDRRIALDGYSYTKQEFQEWYGDHHHSIWNDSFVSQHDAQESSPSVSVPKPDSSSSLLVKRYAVF